MSEEGIFTEEVAARINQRSIALSSLPIFLGLRGCSVPLDRGAFRPLFRDVTTSSHNSRAPPLD